MILKNILFVAVKMGMYIFGILFVIMLGMLGRNNRMNKI
jgi:hypothetical protein